MIVSEIVPGCKHLQLSEKAAILGSPPEVLKFIRKADKPLPMVGILPDITHVNGVSQIALEFPIYWFMFVEHSGKPPLRFRIIGQKGMCDRVAQILSVTLFGPSAQEMKRWKLSKTRIDMLMKMMDYMAMKREGKKLTLLDLFEFVHFPEQGEKSVAVFDDENVRVRRNGDNTFELTDGKDTQHIDLNFEGEQLPLLADYNDELELPQILRVKLLGSYSGFDQEGPTTGIVLWVNCNGFLVDGPVGTSAYLRRLGIPKSDLLGVILTHVHDDHCTLIDMILSEQATNIITTREIYESMLIKVAGAIGEPISQVEQYLNFTEVIPGKPFSMYGAKWLFFYTVHSIPTIGFRVSIKGPDQKEHTIVHSSDTVHFKGLETMRKAGAISKLHEKRMKSLIEGGERLAIMDAGGPPIHGDPSDYDAIMAQNPETEFLFFHAAPSEDGESKYQVAMPGWSRTIIKSKELPQSLILKLLKNLKLLEVSDPAWINILLSQGEVVRVGPNTNVVSSGHSGDDFYFVLAGSQKVIDESATPPQELAILEGGDFFGEMSIVRDEKRNATVKALSASVLFRLPGELFLEFVEKCDLKETFERIWLSRPIISKVNIFRKLHPHAKHKLGLSAAKVSYEKGETVVKQGAKADDFYIITKGQVEVIRRNAKGQKVVCEVLDGGDIFGENVAMGYKNRRTASIVVVSDVLETLRLAGRDLRKLAKDAPILRHELHLVMKRRGMTDIPKTV